MFNSDGYEIAVLDKIFERFSNNLNESDFLEISKPVEEIALPDPTQIDGMTKITDRIFKAINNKEKIIIYGDYDCDGISATTIMVKTFQQLNYKVQYYIPSRYIDGYGLNIENVIKIHDSGFNLIITVDNGISAHEAIDKANELGIDVIVVDHHDLPEIPVNAFGILHPEYSHISNINASGAFTALFLSAALLGKYDDYLVTVAGISIISDSMEVKGYNRDVLKLSIRNLEKHKYKPLVYLMDDYTYNERTYGFQICPKINAIGRVVEDTTINRMVAYLVSENEDEIFKLSSWIKNTNELRKTIQKEAVDSLPTNVNGEEGIVFISTANAGMVGLIANQVTNKFNTASVILTEDPKNPEYLVGSARSKEGINLQNAFKYLNNYLIAGGGHAYAAGLTIKKTDYQNFKEDFHLYCRNNKTDSAQIKAVEISLNEVNFENYSMLRKFAPFGEGFKEPLFVINNLPTKSLQFISGGRHLSTPITINSKIMGWNMGQSEIKAHNFIDLFGSLTTSIFREKLSLEFRVSDYKLKDSM